MTNAHISRLSTHDRKEFVEFRRKASKESDYVNAINDSDFMLLMNSYNVTIGDSKREAYGVFINGKIVGEIILIIEYLDGLSMFIQSIAVLKEYYGKGIASEMMEFLKKEKDQQKIQRIELIVRTDNDRGIAFYKKHGFKKKDDYDNKRDIYYLT